MAEGSVITEKGRALLGKILATNSTLNITGAQIGSGGSRRSIGGHLGPLVQNFVFYRNGFHCFVSFLL